MSKAPGPRTIRVARADLPEEGQMRLIRAGGRQVVLARAQGRTYAFSPFCPHRGGPLAEGRLRQDHVECPWHHHTYRLDTGENLYPANVFPQREDLLSDLGALETFALDVKDDGALLQLPARTPRVAIKRRRAAG